MLNDVEDHRGFARTVAAALKPGGRAVLGFNNPYDYVTRKGHGTAYFATGVAYPCGLSSVGVPVSFYHRTLPEYLDAFLDAGLRLTKIVDVDHPRHCGAAGARRGAAPRRAASTLHGAGVREAVTSARRRSRKARSPEFPASLANA